MGLDTDTAGVNNDEVEHVDSIATPTAPTEEKVSSIAPESPAAPESKIPPKPDPLKIMQDMVREQEEHAKKSKDEAKARADELAAVEKEKKRIRSEMGKPPTEEQLEAQRQGKEHIDEERLNQFFAQLPVVTVVDWEDHDKIVRMPGKVYAARTSAMEDFNGTGDFALAWGDKSWILVDLTAAEKPEALAEKFAAEDRGGPRVLKIKSRTLEEAALGGIYAQQKVVLAIKDMVTRYKEDRLQKPRSRI